MNAENLELAADIVGSTYAKQASDAKRARESKIRILLQHRKLPAQGWDDDLIELFVRDLARMDSNNFSANVGAGEREARIACGVVQRRHFGLGHGVGRSGDIAAIQPKAAGSSLLGQLTQSLALHAIQISGVTRAKSCIVLPLATGMGIVMTLVTLKKRRPNTKYIIWPRIDQKTCFKAMHTAGLIPLVVEPKREGDTLTTDLERISALIAEHGADSILCVISTTSCFAPRVPDKLVEIAKICKEAGIGHIVNNAYGLQLSKCTHLINEAIRAGTLDAFVQSTDKNFMVPVGGSIVASHDKKFIEEISKTYPGRASASPVVDLFMTLLHFGEEGYRKLLADRKAVFAYMKEQLKPLSGVLPMLETPTNQVSIALSLESFGEELSLLQNHTSITYLGSMLFQRGVSGTRVVSSRTKKTVAGTEFQAYGAHCTDYQGEYMTLAAAVGMTEEDVDLLVARLQKCTGLFRKHVDKLYAKHVYPKEQLDSK